jgi:hypothetical protein
MTRHALDPIALREVDAFLGSDRQRQRWQSRGLFSPTLWVHAHGRKFGFFPSFSLAAIVLDRRNAENQLLERIAKAGRELKQAHSTSELERAAQQVISEVNPVDVRAVVSRLEQVALPALELWRDDVTTLAQGLERWGVSFESEFAEIAEVDARFYRLDIPRENAFSLRCAPMPLRRGDWVTADHVNVLGTTRTFLLPAPDPNLGSPVDAEFLDWFSDALQPSEDSWLQGYASQDYSDDSFEDVGVRAPRRRVSDAWRSGNTLSSRF